MPEWRAEVERRLRGAGKAGGQQAEEVAQHLEELYQELLLQGASEAEARGKALEELGTHRNWPRWRPQGWWRDVRFGLRGWRKHPGFAAGVVGMLALGIAAATAVFALAYAELWRPLPVPHPEGLVSIAGHTLWSSFGPNAAEYRSLQHAPGLAEVAAIDYRPMMLELGGRSRVVTVERASPNFLHVLGLAPEMGRGFLPSEARAGSDAEAMLTDAAWRLQFAASADALGKTLRLDGRRYTVVGVLPPAATAVLSLDTVVVPLVFTPEEDGAGGLNGLWVLARLRAGIKVQQAQTLMASYSKSLGLELHGVPVSLQLYLVADRSHAPGRAPLEVLLACVGMVLLVACVNVSALLLARGFGRQEEIAVRQALGATRGRLLRQLLTEGMLLGAAAGGAGLVLARWSVEWLRASALSYTLENLDQARIDAAAMGYCAAVTVVCVLIFGLVPAWRLSRPPQAGLQEGTGPRSRLRGGFLVAEVALTLVLLVGAGLMARSMIRLETVRTGLDVAHVGAIEFDFTPQEMAQRAQIAALAQRLAGALQGRPGWNGLAIADAPPFGDSSSRIYTLAGQRGPQLAKQHAVGPGYFAVVRQRLLAGRAFSTRDTAAAAGVVIVNQAWARQYAPGRSPLGLELAWEDLGRPGAAPPGKALHTVIGVVADARDVSPDLPVAPELYLPFAQTLPRQLALVLEAPDPAAAVRSAQLALALAAPDLAVATAQPLEAFARDDIALPRVQSQIIAALAGLALLLALSGIWAGVAFAVEQRLQEFGIRIALGASAGDILSEALRQMMGLTGIGVAIGLAGAWMMTRGMRAMLYDVRPADPATYLAITALFAAAALAAAYVPARRALRADPVEALRQE